MSASGNPPNFRSQAPVSHGLDVRHLYHVLLDKIWVILLCVVAAAFFTFHYIQKAPIIYAATATLQVEQQEEKVVKIDRVQQEDLRGEEALRTMEQMLQSRALFKRVIDTEGLAKNPQFAAAGATEEQ